MIDECKKKILVLVGSCEARKRSGDCSGLDERTHLAKLTRC